MKKEYIIYKLSEEMKNATRIENELFKKFDVKRDCVTKMAPVFW